jgi:hypothetical protein
VSNPDETETEYRARVSLELREKRDDIIVKLREKYKSKFDALTDKLKQFEQKVEQGKAQASTKKTETYLSLGATLLGSFFGRGITKGTISQAGTSIRKVGMFGKDDTKVQHAEDNYQGCQQRMQELEQELNGEIDKAMAGIDPQKLDVRKVTVRPRKGDIAIDKIALVWRPL